jgi:hypothetical protein
MPFVYHLCPADMHGHTLYPLNSLKAERPDLYDRERPKWDGRESVLTWPVPHLGVPWADTVNLSALDPKLLAAALIDIAAVVGQLRGASISCSRSFPPQA